VTFEQWDAFVAMNSDAHILMIAAGAAGDWPVFNVSWTDACSMSPGCRKRPAGFIAAKRTEWEYCCRAGSTGVFATGERLGVEQANYLYTDFATDPASANRCRWARIRQCFGLCDMHGNVCELIADAWHDNYVDARPTATRHAESNHPGASCGTADGTRCRVSFDALFATGFTKRTLDNTGFRIAARLPLPGRRERAG